MSVCGSPQAATELGGGKHCGSVTSGHFHKLFLHSGIDYCVAFLTPTGRQARVRSCQLKHLHIVTAFCFKQRICNKSAALKLNTKLKCILEITWFQISANPFEIILIQYSDLLAMIQSSPTNDKHAQYFQLLTNYHHVRQIKITVHNYISMLCNDNDLYYPHFNIYCLLYTHVN